jgi:hypothetical protein
MRGTTHVFPVTPYGGPVGLRTHTASRVVNRLSRFHRSAGIDEHRTTTAASSSSGRNSPNPSLAGTSPSVGSLSKMDPAGMLAMMSGGGGSANTGGGGGGSYGNGPPPVVPYPNPYIPPFPAPTLIQPLAQLRQPYLVTLTNQTIGTASQVSRKRSLSAEEPIAVKLAVTFASTRAWLLGSSGAGGQYHPHQLFSLGRQQRRPHESLFVVANHGVLLEYTLDVLPDSSESHYKHK